MEHLKRKIKAKIYEISIYDCGLSVRSINVLKDNSFKTIGDLFSTPDAREELTHEQLLLFRNCGKLTVEEIMRLMKFIKTQIK